MKIIDSVLLAQMSYESMKALTLSGEQFAILTKESNGDRIRRFLTIESNYLSGTRSFMDRIRYFIGSASTYPDAAFGLLWNRARMDGYLVTEIRKLDECVEIHFCKQRSS